MPTKTWLAPSSCYRVAHISLWFILPIAVRVFCARGSSGPSLVLEPPKKVKEGSSSDGSTTTAAAAAAAAVALPEVSSIQVRDIPFVQQPGRFVREVQ